MVYSKENYKFDLGVKGLSLLKGPVIKYLMMQSLVQWEIISDKNFDKTVHHLGQNYKNRF